VKQSKFALKIKREIPKDADSKNAAFLVSGGYVNKLMAGVYSYLPLGYLVLKNLEEIIRQEMQAIGGQELLLPALAPKENWQQTGRWQDLDILYKFKVANGKEIALNPTHEEIITPLAKSMISSYKDLPLYLFQIQNKFRNEIRAKSGLLRGREFIMKDLYSFHLDDQDLDQYYDKVIGAYKKIFKRSGIGRETVLAFASGGSFSKYSHEFQTLAESGEDLIYLCPKCQVAVNREIIDEVKNCPNCNSNDLEEKKSIEVGNIFKLKTKYSQAFNLSITDRHGDQKTVVMGCYGIGLSRLLATIVEIIATEKKIVWPTEVAPFSVHLISINQDQISEEIYLKLTKQKIKVIFDDRDATPGEKFSDADFIGSPIRIIISTKSITAGGAEVTEVSSGRSKIVPLDKITGLDSLKN